MYEEEPMASERRQKAALEYHDAFHGNEQQRPNLTEIATKCNTAEPRFSRKGFASTNVIIINK